MCRSLGAVARVMRSRFQRGDSDMPQPWYLHHIWVVANVKFLLTIYTLSTLE
jgi:hypothetical protein